MAASRDMSRFLPLDYEIADLCPRWQVPMA